MRRTLPALLCVPLLLAACSSPPDEPAALQDSDFRPGTCRAAAAPLLALGRALPRLGDEPTVGQDVQDVLLEAQDGLATAVDGAEPRYAVPVQDLVESIGGVRIRAVGRTYDPALGEGLRGSYERVLEVCTGSQ